MKKDDFIAKWSSVYEPLEEKMVNKDRELRTDLKNLYYNLRLQATTFLSIAIIVVVTFLSGYLTGSARTSLEIERRPQMIKTLDVPLYPDSFALQVNGMQVDTVWIYKLR